MGGPAAARERPRTTSQNEERSRAVTDSTSSVDTLTPVLTANWGDERAWKLANYERTGGYTALRTR